MLRQHPIVLAPMLIYAVAMALAQNVLGFDFQVVNRVAVLWLLGSGSISLAVQLWMMAMIFLGSTTPDIEFLSSVKLGLRRFIPVWILLLLQGSVGMGLMYWAYTNYHSQQWLSLWMAALAALWLAVFGIYSALMPVAVVVEPAGFWLSFRVVAQLLRFRFWILLRFMLLILSLVLTALTLSMLFTAAPFVPPLLQGLITAYVHCLAFFFYLNVTRVNVVS